MERFSVFNPSTHFQLSEADRLALATAVTPGEHVGDRPESGYAGTALPSYYGASRKSGLDAIAFADCTDGTRKSRLNTITFAVPTNDHQTAVEKRRTTTILQQVVFKPDARFYLAFSALASLSLVVAIDGTSISVALPVIAKKLNGSATEAFWAGTSFLLTSTVFQPIYAAFSHIFGRKNVTLLAVVFFLTGTIIAATSVNMTLMLVGRTIQGIGGGGIIALANVILTDLVPLRYRGNWVGILGAMWAIGSVSGPVVGGTLAHPYTWEWIFWLNVPFIFTSFIMVFFFIRLKPLSIPFKTKLQRVDWVGSVIFVASTTAILVPLTWGGTMYPWTSWRTIAPIGFGHAGFIILGYHERFVAIEPVIRTVVFRNKTTNIAYMTTAMHGMVLWSLLYYQPLYFEGVRGFSPVISGVALFPATFTVAPMAIVAGIVISKYGTYRFAVWGGWACTTLGVGFLCAVNVDTQLVQILLTDFITGVGLGR